MKFYFLSVAFLFFTSCNNNGDAPAGLPENDKPLTGIAAPQNLPINIIGIYPHDTSAYTQGLEIYNGKLYESTGDYQNSSLRITDIKTGQVVKKHAMGSSEIFGEGITILNNKIYQLTWRNHLVNVYDINNIDKPIKTFNWPYEGWGITHNDTDLIISDGSANLFFVNPEDFRIKSTKQVTDNIGSVTGINELEYFDGYVFANVYGRDIILKVNPANGHVAGIINLPKLIQQYAKDFSPDDNEVLNGIAWDSAAKKMYITGKRWPKMFEIIFN